MPNLAAHAIDTRLLSDVKAQLATATPSASLPAAAPTEFNWSQLAAGRLMLVDEVHQSGHRWLIAVPCLDDWELRALTAIEERIARRAGQALSNKQIASALRLSESTVENHLSRALRKLGIRDRVALARLYTQLEAAGHA